MQNFFLHIAGPENSLVFNFFKIPPPQVSDKGVERVHELEVNFVKY